MGQKLRLRLLRLLNVWDVHQKAIVIQDLPEVEKSATLIWILPLISMIIGYIVGERFADGFWPIGAAFVFLVLAFAFLKVLDKAISGGRTFYPVITRIICPSGKENTV